MVKDEVGWNEKMTSVFDQFGYFTSWWSSIIAGVVIIGGALIIIKICLDCPGLVHFICCCGHNPDSQIPTYKLEIVYRVSAQFFIIYSHPYITFCREKRRRKRTVKI